MKEGRNVESKVGSVRSNNLDEGGIHGGHNPNIFEEEEYAIVPPNGGWGWVVVMSAFYCNLVADGIQFTFGLYLRNIAEYFGTEEWKISLMGSLMFGVHLLIGPICSGVNNLCGIRPVAITGSLLTAFSIAISYFSPNYQFMYVFYGVFGGVGLGFVYMNTILITSMYFTSFRVLALGLVVCGTGCGTIIFALLGNELLKLMDWRKSFLVEAALAGSMGAAALSFRPLKRKRIVFTRDETLLKAKYSVLSKVSKTSKPPSKFSIFTEGGESLTRKSHTPSLYIRKGGSFISSLSVQNKEVQKVMNETIIQQLSIKPTSPCCRRCCHCCRRERVLFVHPSLKEEQFVEITDIVSGSLSTIVSSEISSQTTWQAPQASVHEKKAPRRRWHCGPMKQTILAVFDFKLLRSYAFLMYCTSGGFAMSGILIYFIYGKDMSTTVLGFSEDTATYLLVTLGGANTFWRLFLGFISTGIKINKTYTSIALSMIGSVAIISSTLSNNLYFQYFCTVINALPMASFAVFRPVILIDLFGSDLLINASGLSLLFVGAMCILSPPLSGWMMEVTKNHKTVFYAAGCLHAVSALLLIRIQQVREYDLKQTTG